jgi:hypothetical protein
MIDIQLAEADWAGVETGVQALLDKWLVPISAPLLKGQPIASVVLVKAVCDRAKLSRDEAALRTEIGQVAATYLEQWTKGTEMNNGSAKPCQTP